MIRKIIIISIFALFVTSIFISSAFRKKSDKLLFKNIIGKEYRLIVDNNITDITVNFSEDKVYGHAGVNRYSSQYKIINNEIEFSAIISTMMAGPEEKMAMESEFLKKFNNVNKINLEKNLLILITKNNEKLIFVDSIEK